MALDEGISYCFVSRARVNGKEVSVDVGAAKRIKQQAVLRGFATKNGDPRKNLTVWEKLVMLMRDATSGEEFNHEWWAAEISKPGWVQKLDTLFEGGWLYYPNAKNDLAPRHLGNRIGYQLALEERKLSRAIADSAYRSEAEKVELARAVRGNIDRENTHKYRLAIPGYASWKKFAEENVRIMPRVRSVVVAIAGDQPLPNAGMFLEGLTQGTKRAQKVDLDNELSEYNDREEVVAILSDYWPVIDRMGTRREITDFILERLPENRRRFLVGSPRKADQQDQYKRFVERLRQTYYEPIGLRPKARGRPENREKDS